MFYECLFHCFFFFFKKNILRIPLPTRNTRVIILAFTMPAGVPRTVRNEKREIPQLVPNRTRSFVCITKCCNKIVKYLIHFF